MLTQKQRDIFRLALASHNNYTIKNVAELDIDDVCTSDEKVVETFETVESFLNTRGRRLDRQGKRPTVPYELESTIMGNLYVWQNQQARKGRRRGTLWLMDFGDVRAAYFDGEI